MCFLASDMINVYYPRSNDKHVDRNKDILFIIPLGRTWICSLEHKFKNPFKGVAGDSL